MVSVGSGQQASRGILRMSAYSGLAVVNALASQYLYCYHSVIAVIRLQWVT
jgi:hypothetical protein